MILLDQELMRIGVSLPENLLSKFDAIIEKRGYSSRSEGIRDAIRNYITHYEWMSDVKGRRVGTITLIYDHTKRGLSSALTDIQHEYAHLIKSAIHIHLDHDNCLEVVILDGEGEDVKAVAERIMSLKGVTYVKLNTALPAET
ncbi:MAG: CopG family transcriptional regulator [Methanolobus sp. T82-4]|nr:MAG: CopG family transcriptional regulator [Methanolobus sp. T82-4]